MNSVASQEKRFIRLAPSNNSTSGYSPDSSQPIIKFSIADAPAWANMSEARLNFRIRIERSSGVAVAQTDDFNVDRTVGLSGVVDQVIISSRRYGTQLEAIHNYGRLNSAVYSGLWSPKQMWSNVGMQSRAIGKGSYNPINSNHRNYRTEDGTGSRCQRKNLVTSATATGKSSDLVDCSIPIHAGLFLSERVNLMQVGGLELAFFLQRSNFLFHGTGTNPPTANSTYTLYDVSLTVPLLYMSSQDIQANRQSSQNVLSFMNWTSLYSVIDSTSSSIAHRINLRGLLSSIHNSQPTNDINSVSHNNFALKNSGVRELTFLRDGVKNPMEKTVLVARSNNTAQGNISQNTLSCEVENDYLGAYRNPRDVLYTQVIPENLKGRGAYEGVFGWGANYDPSSGAGINVAGVLSQDMKTALQDVDDATATESYAMYSFYLSRKDLMISPQGVVEA